MPGYRLGVAIKGVFRHARGLYVGRRVMQIYVVLAILKDLMTGPRKRSERSERSGSQMMVRDVLLLHDTNVAADYYGTPR